MPQSPTANMALVKPTENGDTGVWASLLDAMFDLIDQHDHTTGKGVKIPSAALNINADVAWNSGGNFFALTGVKALDFQPQATSGMTTYAGALFCNSANNELTWRSTGGSLVQLTNGAAINISGVGGFAGDYISVAAQADYTDASNTYAFRQKLGGGVRQFAHAQVGDLDLFEFKANPTAGVPTNRVRLKSPAALAASYDVTMPSALPANLRIVQLDNAGVLQTPAASLPASLSQVRISSAGVLTYQPLIDEYHAAFAQADGIGTCTFDGTKWALGVGSTITCPIKLPVGMTFTTWTVFLSKLSSAAGTLQARLGDVNMASGTESLGGITSNSANAPGLITLSGSGTTITANHAYSIRVNCPGASGDFIYGWSITP